MAQVVCHMPVHYIGTDERQIIYQVAPPGIPTLSTVTKRAETSGCDGLCVS